MDAKQNVEPISIKKRRALAYGGDRTVNAVEDGNTMPKSVLLQDATVNLIDGFVRDGWILPEDRMMEIAVSFQQQMASASRRERRLLRQQEQEIYADGWVSRILEYQAHE